MSGERECPTCRGAGRVTRRTCVDCGRAVAYQSIRCPVCAFIRNLAPHNALRRNVELVGIPFADLVTAIRREPGRVVFEYAS